ncbi:photosynthetic reaction center cytochrome PufC [Variovorax sp. J22R133]|uniref:photosynthetic reaction center cytochrome PufC n=1 Tax=Variovorax brevis TaxID=3053503 RepID=UPI002575F0FC|nr:photosynthetic reaction center cytochrome PufC [Variovorax sp. J22R133]MDM0113800.1 photosynthetic reaction center cytochrome PufC [Variovorax sp. J22R133]
MTNSTGVRWCVALGALALLVGCFERPPVDAVQRGFRGTGMDQIYNPRSVQQQAAINGLPPDTPPMPAVGPTAGQTFQNVKVLNDLSVGEFSRLMVSITAWVAPQQGCTYCHAGNDMASDALYTKVVARRMLQMTQHINADWKNHVADTGVTCYTCHRGQPVPANTWTVGPSQKAAYSGNKAGQNTPLPTSGMTALPYDPFTPFLQQANNIRVVGGEALQNGNRISIKQTEWTYGLMVHMSESLGVNCTYCHNTRSFADWETSTPPRATAWYGIRMARDLNLNYLDPLAPTFPAARLGAGGYSPKINCATCHQGAYKPLYGQSMLPNHPELAKVRAVVATGAPAAPAAPTAPAASGSASAEVLFAVGSKAVSDDGTKALGAVIDALKADATARVTLSGFHSATGDTATNEELAKQRAFAVRDALQAAGIAQDRIVLEKPQVAEANVAGEDPRARRVEVAVMK